MDQIIEAGPEPFEVVIAGGGVAGLEALLALRALAGSRVRAELVAPDRDFVYRPLSVAEPFGITEPKHVTLDGVIRDCDAHQTRASLAAVEPDARAVVTDRGERIRYDALLLATGARAVEAIPGALTFTGPEAVPALSQLIAELDRGGLRSVAFVAPAAVSWTLPLYELALLTAGHLRRRGAQPVELVLVTHEQSPLSLFRRVGANRVGELLAEAGIALETDAVAVGFDGGQLRLAGGRALDVDSVVAMPRLEVPDIPGIPQNARGFIATDVHGRVPEVERVFAAGDATWFPVKQGGIATQQADAAAAAIAQLAGADVDDAPAVPLLRAALLTGESVEYLSSSLGRAADARVARGALWWPPGKIAGRYLAPYLAHGTHEPGPSELVDLEPFREQDPEATDAGQHEALLLALEAADAEAGWGDYEAALKWLEAAEQLNIVLPPDYAERRSRWREQVAAG